MPLLEVSPGELFDKLTILQIKLARVPPDRQDTVREALRNVREALAGVDETTKPNELTEAIDELRATNEQLWDLEDCVRDLLARDDRGPRFVDAAAAVPVLNDRRAAAKREIDRVLKYAAPEVKWYTTVE